MCFFSSFLIQKENKEDEKKIVIQKVCKKLQGFVCVEKLVYCKSQESEKNEKCPTRNRSIINKKKAPFFPWLVPRAFFFSFFFWGPGRNLAFAIKTQSTTMKNKHCPNELSAEDLIEDLPPQNPKFPQNFQPSQQNSPPDLTPGPLFSTSYETPTLLLR